MRNLHRAFFFALIALLPVQLGRHFWPEWSYILGLRIDYLAPTIYLTDLLIGGIITFWFWEKRKQLTISKQLSAIKKYWWVIAVFFYLLVNSLLAQNPGVALYKFFKIIELTLLGLYLAKSQPQLPKISQPLSLAVIYTSLIAMIQFIWQRSLGGPFWWLGERTFSAFTPGIAEVVLNGRLLMRPYATFPHPNVLAGFLLVSLILIGIANQKLKKKQVLWWPAVILGIVTIGFSFSRSVWLVGLASLLPMAYCFFPKKKTLTIILPIAVVGLIAGLYLALQLPLEEAVSQRFELTKATLSMIKAAPVMGVGLNNFIVRLPEYWQGPETIRFLQPVHNIFLLIASETGLVGLLIFFWFLILTFKKSLVNVNWQLIIPLLAILLTGVTDHYWLTLQQPQLLLTVVFGLLWGIRKS